MKIASFQNPQVRVRLHQDSGTEYALEWFDYRLLSGGSRVYGTLGQALEEFYGLVGLYCDVSES